MKSKLSIASLSLLLIVVIFAAAAPSYAQVAQSNDKIDTIHKIANKSICARGEAINYIINYTTGVNKSEVMDILPEVEFLSATPAPTSHSGNVLTWEVEPNSNGIIEIDVLVPQPNNITYDESSSVYGNGFVNIRKSLSTARDIDSLSNTAILYNNTQPVASDFVVVGIKGMLGTQLKSAEHGSGNYSAKEIANLNTTIHKISLAKGISATHKPTTFRLPKNRTISYSSTWSDLTNTKNRYTNDSLTESYQYMRILNKESAFRVDKTQTVYRSKSNFSGGIASVDYVKTTPHTTGASPTTMQISETYHGDFATEQSLDSYGSSASYTKYANGTGYVSSEKNAGCTLRSSEHGSGNYELEEIFSSSNIIKSSNMTYMPNNQSADGFGITYQNKWDELLYARNTTGNSEIVERISSADYIKKEALVGPAFLGLTGRFNGTEYLRARLLKSARVLDSASETAVVERTLVGNYRLDTTVAIAVAPKYLYPHLSLTKKVTANDGTYITYKINVTNDGNKTLAPVEVIDVLPEGTSFYSSSRRPSVQGRIVSWSLTALTIGAKESIELKVKINYESLDMLNRVKAVAIYENRTILAEASAPQTIEEQVEQGQSQKYNVTANFSSGLWRPPPCFGLGLNLTECDKAIEDYYKGEDNTTGGCCPQIVDVL